MLHNDAISQYKVFIKQLTLFDGQQSVLFYPGSNFKLITKSGYLALYYNLVESDDLSTPRQTTISDLGQK